MLSARYRGTSTGREIRVAQGLLREACFVRSHFRVLSTMSVSSSSVDDGVTEEINIGTDSSYGKQKRGEEVQRRRTRQTGELTPIRAAILDGRVGRRQTV